jgi:hypothetical protein
MRDGHSSIWNFLVAAAIALLGASGARSPGSAAASPAGGARVRLPGHVLPALARATRTPTPRAAGTAPLTLTLVLRRDDQTGFERYLHDVYDPASPRHRRFLSQRELSERFGPSEHAYERVLGHLQGAGFALVEGSANRLTLTVRGTRAAAERALGVDIGYWRTGDRTFFANADDPALPASIAAHVQSVAGLANLAQPRPAKRSVALAFAAVLCQLRRHTIPPPVYCRLCGDGLSKAYNKCLTALKHAIENDNAPIDWNTIAYSSAIDQSDIVCSFPGLPPPDCPSSTTTTLATTLAVHPAGAGGVGVVEADGTGQTVAIVGFDTFQRSDIEDFLALVGQPASRIDALSRVAVNGGAPLGPDQDEVLLDVTTVMMVALGAEVVVYDAPFTGPGTSFQALFNAAIDGGATVISNSWAYCEDQTSLADVQSLDAIFQSAAASNISIFNAAGDTGSTCLDGSPNTVAVPAGSPNATAVGGSTVTGGEGKGRLDERWWDGTGDTPPTGQGGFGVSRFFSRPSYQDGLTTSPMRSVPDVVASADPVSGVMICQASKGGCPTGAFYGGTSFSAPLWAAHTAVLNDALGDNLGFMNAALYPLAGTPAFHDAAELESDFAHVGLGSMNFDQLYLQLSGTTLGPPDAAGSHVTPVIERQAFAFLVPIVVPADGESKGFILVTLLDDNRHAIAGKTVTLAANAGSSVTISPASAVTDSHGQASFQVTNLVAEDVTFTATDTTDGIVLADTPTLTFEVPSAAAGGIVATPPEVTANGIATATITVTLEDAFGRPTPGKEVRLSQGGGHAQVNAPDPAVTDENGQIAFTAVNLVNETVVFTAVDVTDDELPIPGSAQVAFTNGAPGACGSEEPPAGEGGNLVTPWSTGFEAGQFFYGSVTWFGCPGASNPTFDAGRGYVANFRTGELFDMGLQGGAASSDLVVFDHAPTLGQPTFGKDGKLYATFAATTGNFTTGAIVELDPATGEIIRNVATNLTCPGGLVVDPLSGDLFFDGGCTGAGSDDARIRRVVDPGGATPMVVDYATLPSTPNAAMSFAPNGTLYAATGYFNNPNTPIVRVTGTDTADPGEVTPVMGVTTQFGAMAVAEALPSGEAKSLFVVKDGDLMLVDITTDPPTSTLMATNLGVGTTGPDGCLYASTATNVYKLTGPGGSCPFTPTNPSPSLALTPSSAEAAQGTEHAITATFHNLDVPAGTPVFFEVSGANPRVQMVRTDAAGQAVLRYTGVGTGSDVIRATATPGDSFVSNRASIAWSDGKHTTALTLNPSPLAGAPGQPVEVVAALVDASEDPAAALAGQTIAFTLGGAGCSGTTDAGGLARCQVTPPAAGNVALSASFAGTATLLPSSDQVGFNVFVPTGRGGGLLDAFLAYKGRSARGAPKLPKFGPIQLDDGVGNGGYDVKKPTTLANPAGIDGANASDAATHLVGYAIKQAKGSAKFRATQATLTSVCGQTTATLKKPAELLVPSTEDPTTAVTPPADGVLDHYLCYRAKGPKLAKGTQVEVADQLGVRRYDLKAISMVCNPTSKSGEPTIKSGKQKGEPFPITPATVGDPDMHLVCWTAKLSSRQVPQRDGGCGPADPQDKGTKAKQEKPPQLRGTNVANQLQTGKLDTKKPAVLCLPAT